MKPSDLFVIAACFLALPMACRRDNTDHAKEQPSAQGGMTLPATRETGRVADQADYYGFPTDGLVRPAQAIESGTLLAQYEIRKDGDPFAAATRRGEELLRALQSALVAKGYSVDCYDAMGWHKPLGADRPGEMLTGHAELHKANERLEIMAVYAMGAEATINLTLERNPTEPTPCPQPTAKRH